MTQGFKGEKTGVGAIADHRSRADDDLRDLRASAAVKVAAEIVSFEDALKNLHELAKTLGSQSSDESVKKKLGKIERSVTVAITRLAEMNQRVDALEDAYKMMRFRLLDAVKKEYINVPAKTENAKRMAIMPFDAGEVKKRKRRNAALPMVPTATGGGGGSGKGRGKGDDDDDDGDEDEDDDEEDGAGKKRGRGPRKAPVNRRKKKTANKKKSGRRVLPVPVASTTTKTATIKRDE